jgi:hypothetical protein
MSFSSTHCARITGPIPYETAVGGRQHIPLGPCVIEGKAGECVDVIWGRHGQKSASLPMADMQSAREQGNLVLLD